MIWVIPYIPSPHKDVELVFMLRGLHKYEPDAEPLLIGHKPMWYTGAHVYYPHDVVACKERNIMDKLLVAAQLYNEFIFTNDDHYLLAPFNASRYYAQGTLKDMNEVCFGGPYKRTIENTAKLVGWTHPYFDVHTPMLIESRTLVNCYNAYNWARKPTYLVKTLYANWAGAVATPFVDKKYDSPYDVAELQAMNAGRWIFTTDHLYAGIIKYFNLVYKTKSPWEL